MIPIAKPLLGKEEKEAVLKVLDSGIIAHGENVTNFENEFAKFIGVKHAIATTNGTTALHASLLAHGIKEGDEVITTPFTFIATANTIKLVGATPIFVDIDESFNINPDLIEEKITSKTKAIMPVHIFGRCANMQKIIKIANKHNLIIIEDACQAHGAQFNGKNAGSFGTGCFSLYATKNMTTGEGGMITTNDDEVATRLRKIINHGSKQKYYHDIIGHNFRLTNLSAAIGLEQLKKLKDFNFKRIKNAKYYNEHLKDTNLILPKIVQGHVFHQYTIRSKNRDQLIKKLNDNNIGTGIFYPIPVHKQESFNEYNHLSLPFSEKLASEALSIPIGPYLTKADLDKIISILK